MEKLGVKLLDGGFSSQLFFHVNQEVERNHPLWCARFLITDPTSVINTHRDYIRAGSNIVTTNSYQASIEGFQKYLGLEASESIKLIGNSVDYVKQALELENISDGGIKKKIKIAGSVGSYGACLHDGSEYRGEYVKSVSMEVIKNWHRPRMQALVKAGVDYLAIETIPALAEAEVLVELLREFPGQKAWISFTCQDEKRTSAKDDIGAAAKRLWSMNKEQLVAIGMNCLDPSLVSPLLKCIKSAAEDIPVVAYPNNGEVYDVVANCWKDKGNPPVESYLQNWLNDGISIVGGCCRTTAKDIHKFKGILMERGNYISMEDM